MRKYREFPYAPHPVFHINIYIIMIHLLQIHVLFKTLKTIKSLIIISTKKKKTWGLEKLSFSKYVCFIQICLFYASVKSKVYI